jgi:hypothetical protein
VQFHLLQLNDGNAVLLCVVALEGWLAAASSSQAYQPRLRHVQATAVLSIDSAAAEK